jgi:hypothetical protein
MYTGNVWGIALFIAGFLAALIGFQLLLGALAPRRTADGVRALAERPWLAAAFGVAAAAVLVVAAFVLSRFGGPGKFLSGLVVALSTFPVGLGLGVVSRFVGERMPSPADAGRPWRATLRGGVTLALTFALPIVGWFLVLPAAAAVGLGAVAAGVLVPSRLAEPAGPAAAGV